jgi:hypothetical protein
VILGFEVSRTSVPSSSLLIKAADYGFATLVRGRCSEQGAEAGPPLGGGELG